VINYKYSNTLEKARGVCVKSTLREIGERDSVKLIRAVLDSASDIGEGDDCAVLELGDNYLLLTTDVIVEGRHFPRGTDGRTVGWLVVAVNLSDIAAMGGKPLGVVVAAALPKHKSAAYLKAVSRGMKACAASFDTEVVGGDTKESRITTLAGFALGIAPKDKVMLRKGAKPGDMLAVTGTLGLAAAGYHSIKSKPKKGSKKGLEALLKPRPLIGEGLILSGTGKVTSCMDLSDSLASSLHQLSELNNVGFEVEYEKLPISKEVHSCGIEPKRAALYFGGDYQLLLTIKKNAFSGVKKSLKKSGTNLTIIGRVTKKADKILIVDDKIERLENKSYEHFK